MGNHGHNHPWKRLGDGSLLTQDADEGLGHILPMRVYATTLGVLLFLTLVTVWVAQYDLGALNAVVAVIVASVKAALVAMFFMHLKFEPKLIILYAFYPLILLFLLVGSNVADIETREHVVPTFGEAATRQDEHLKQVEIWNQGPAVHHEGTAHEAAGHGAPAH